MTSPGAPIDGHRVERMTRVMIARAALPLDLERVYAQGSAWCVVVRDRTGRVVELVIPRRATAAAFRVDLKRFLEAAAPPRAVADPEVSARFTAALQPRRDDAARAIGVALHQTVGSADTDVAARIVAARLGDATIAAVHLLQARLPPSGDTGELARRRSRIRERASGLAADIIVTCVEQGVLRRDQMAIGLQTVVAREVFHYLVAVLAEWDTQSRE